MTRRESAKDPVAVGKRDHPGLQAEAQAGGPSLTLEVMLDGEPLDIEISSFADVPANVTRRVDAGMPEEVARAAAHDDLVAGMVRLQEIAMAYGPFIAGPAEAPARRKRPASKRSNSHENDVELQGRRKPPTGGRGA